MKTTQNLKTSILEKEMKMIFKEISKDSDELEENVRDAMKAFVLVKQDTQNKSIYQL